MNLNAIRKELKPIYDASMEARKDGMRLILGALFAIVLCVIMVMVSGALGLMMPLIFIIFITTAVVGFIYAKSIAPVVREYEHKVKQIVFPEVFRQHFTEVIYEPAQGFDKTVMKKYAVIDLGVDYETEDYLQGKYRDVRFSRADIETSTTVTTSNGKTTTTHTTVYFHGQVYKFDFNKKVDAYIRVREKGGFLSGSFSNGDRVFGSSKVKFEDDDFNDRFHTVSNDEQFAFYVFTPQFMEKIKKLSSLTRGDIGLVFYEDTMFLACYSRTDSFEFNAKEEINESMVRNLESEIDIIKLVIDSLNLDIELFKERS